MPKGTCIVVDEDGVPCPKPAAKVDMCDAHYAKQRRYGNPLAGRTNRPAGQSKKVTMTCSVVENGERCPRFVVAYEWCGKHHQRWKKHGDPLGGYSYEIKPADMTERDWILAGYDRSGGEDACHPWTRGKDGKTGYGKAQYDGRILRTHVIAWMIANDAEVPEGLVICHSCIDSRLCGNHKHLRADTPQANAEDMVRDKRSARGSRHSQSKLTEPQVLDIKHQIAEGGTNIDIAAQFGVSRRTINSIRSGQSWGWLTE